MPGICIPTNYWNRFKKLDNGCWEWTGCKLKAGYGRVKSAGIVVLVHRLSWELIHGEIPEGLCVLHKCDYPPCGNPDHLFLGTQTENMIDRSVKGRCCSGGEHPMSKLNKNLVLLIRSEYDKGNVGYRSLGKKYNVNDKTISALINGRTWNFNDNTSN